MFAFLGRLRTRKPVPSTAFWHPHFGDIAGRTLAAWLDEQALAPAPRVFIILASEERSGSEWLCRLIGDTGVLGRPTEYFNSGWMRRFIADYPEDAAGQAAIARRVGTTPNGCLATKLHAQHFDRISKHISLADLFPDMRFVRLTRRDLLRQAISLVRARQTESFHAHVSPVRDAWFDEAGIASALAEIAKFRARWSVFFARNGIEPVLLDYEDVVRHPSWSLARIGAAANIDVPRRSIDMRDGLRIQRDAISEEWRARFLERRGNRNQLDRLLEPCPPAAAS
jgi:trehalose 2-sulfotransferase